SSALPRSILWHEPDEAEFKARVARKAYELFERRGCAPGHDLEDWVQAERLVREEMSRDESSDIGTVGTLAAS
ncbi:MAG TPA: DUF2934 domain-containing protein, partial [Nitrospiraceae bacterium]|nr:DUF2934 domain-containing protein [Nitrospiraceae bacterium]